jgi:hypothetical protein
MNIRPVLYLDIDGVLLTKKQQVPEGTPAFLDFALAHFDCFWLSTHCKSNAKTALRYLTSYYPADLIPKIQAVQPTNWDTLKTEGIDFGRVFFWIDDYPFEAEKNVLQAHRQLAQLIICDLRQEHELSRIGRLLQAQLVEPQRTPVSLISQR